MVKRKKGKVKLNLSLCHYPILRVVADDLGYKEAEEEEEDWVLYWSDTTLHIDKLIHLKFFQKCNHFPGMSEITRKDTLGRNLKRLQRKFPESYDYFPKTFTLPSDFGELRQYFPNNGISSNIFIVKPEASSQGKGIYLTRSLDEIDPMSHIIVQEYLSSPLLIDNTKFDMRIYVLVTSCDPLRIYLYREGIARFATEEYVPPTTSNLGQVYMHLTNYSINKFSDKFVEADDMTADFGSKRSISSVFQRLRKDGYDTNKIWKDISDVIIKTLIAIQPKLKHIYNTCFPNDVSGGTMCCELLGFDIILEKSKEGQIKPWLLEVNHSPSLNMDTRIDRELKSQVLTEIFHILDLKNLYKLSKSKSRSTKPSKDGETKLEEQAEVQMEGQVQTNPESAISPDKFNTNLLSTMKDTSLSAMEKLRILKGEKPLPRAEEKERKKQEKRREKLEKSTSTLKAEVARSISTGFLLIYPLSNKDPLPLETNNKIPGQWQEDTNYKPNLFLELNEEKYSNFYIPIPLAETAASQLRRESIIKQQEEKAQKELEELFRLKRKVVKRTVSSTTPIRPRYLEPRKPHSAQEVQQYGAYQYKVDPTYSDYQNTSTLQTLENNNPPQSISLSHSIHIHQTFPIEGEQPLLVKGKSSTFLNFHVNDSITYVSCLDLKPKDSSFQTKDRNATLPQLVGVTRSNNLGNNKITQEKIFSKVSSPKNANEIPFGNMFSPLNSFLFVKPIQFVARN